MTHIEQAIRDAVEKGGWIASCCVDVEKNWQWYKADIFLDPLFWQALGKARGLEGSFHMDNKYGFRLSSWKHDWHRFIDHLADGKDAESFFKTLV